MLRRVRFDLYEPGMALGNDLACDLLILELNEASKRNPAGHWKTLG
jgi:hypothetical protein